MSAGGDADTNGKAEVIVTNGRITTQDEACPFASSAAVRGGRFVAGGSDADVMPLRGARTRVIDAGGRTVIPGLNDSHTHPIRGGLNYNMELRWDGVPSLADALRMGREIFRPAPGTNTYTSIVRFAETKQLNDWVASDARREFVARASGLLEKGDRHEIMTGLDFWFTPKGAPAPARWKQFLLTTSAVYPLSLFIPRLLAPLFEAAPALGRRPVAALLMAAILTGLLTFVVMPPYTRLMRRWLFARS